MAWKEGVLEAVGREPGGGSVCCAADGAGVGLAHILVCNSSCS